MRIVGSSDSFDAAKRTLGLAGSNADAISVWIPWACEMSWTSVPATFHGLPIGWR